MPENESTGPVVIEPGNAVAALREWEEKESSLGGFRVLTQHQNNIAYSRRTTHFMLNFWAIMALLIGIGFAGVIYGDREICGGSFGQCGNLQMTLSPKAPDGNGLYYNWFLLGIPFDVAFGLWWLATAWPLFFLSMPPDLSEGQRKEFGNFKTILMWEFILYSGLFLSQLFFQFFLTSRDNLLRNFGENDSTTMDAWYGAAFWLGLIVIIIEMMFVLSRTWSKNRVLVVTSFETGNAGRRRGGDSVSLKGTSTY